jgi:protocatechuate 3,4-dioxygenase beta subunit
MSVRRAKHTWLGFGVLVCVLLSGLLALPAMALAAPGGTISGIVTDAETGDPVSTSLYAERIGSPGWGEAVTRSGGHYTISGLPDGEYVVSAYAWSGSYYNQYYNGKQMLKHADRVRVLDGETVTVNVRFKKAQAFAADVDEPDNTFGEATLVKPDGSESIRSIFPDADIDFRKIQVRAGRLYSVRSEALWGAGIDGAWTTMDLFDGQRRQLADDVWEDLKFVPKNDGYVYVSLQARHEGRYVFAVDESVPATISGTVIADDTHQPLENVRAELYAVEQGYWGSWTDWAGSKQTDSDGKYAFSSLVADKSYRMRFDTSKVPAYAGEWYDDLYTVNDEFLATPVNVTAGNTTVVDGSLARGATVSGVVRDEDSGAPIANIAVEVTMDGVHNTSGYNTGWTFTDSLGQYSVASLAPGTYKVSFVDSMSGYASEWHDNKASSDLADPIVLAANDARTIDAELALRPEAANVVGVVTDKADGSGVDTIEVKAEPIGWTDSSGYHEGEPLGALSSGYSSGYWTYTDRNGAYRLGGLGTEFDPSIEVKWRIKFIDPRGGYLMQYFDGASIAEDAEDVTLPRGGTFEANARLDVNPDTALITGKVTDEVSGNPIVGAWVSWGTKSGYEMSGYDSGVSGYGMSSYAYTDSNGEFKARGVPAGTLLTVGAGADDRPFMFYDHKPTAYLADQVTFTLGEVRTMDFALRPWGELKGRITEDGTDRPLAGIKVDVLTNQSMSGGWAPFLSGYEDAIRTDKDGRYTIPEANPYASYKLHFSDDGVEAHLGEWYNGKSDETEADEVQVPSSSSATFDASLARNAALGRVLGTVTSKATGDPIGTIQVDAFTGTENPDGSVSIGDFVDREHTLPDGTYMLAGLAPGTYYLRFSDPLERVESQWFDNEPLRSDRQTKVVVPAGGDAPVANAALYTADNDAPTTADDVSSPYFGSATIKVSAHDNISGVKQISYSLDSAEPVVSGPTTATISVDILGDHTLEYWATDFAGNTSSHTAKQFRIDALGSLSGSVTSSGAPLAGVSVKLGSLPTTLTGAGGGYDITGVAPGTYSVVFSKSGYETQTVTGVEIVSGANTTQNAALVPLTFTLGSTAGVGGTITGTQTVLWGEDATFTITPNSGYRIADVMVDGVSQGTVASYTFAHVTANHSIAAVFATQDTIGRTNITIKRKPSGSALVYKRKRGVAKYTLSATFSDKSGARLKGIRVYLQSSSNGRTWTKNPGLTTDSFGVAKRSFKIRSKRKIYYRWFSPETATYFAAYTSKQKVTVK